MGARDRIDQQVREQSTSEQSMSLSEISETLEALNSTVTQLVESQNRTTETVRELKTSKGSTPSFLSIADVQNTLDDLTTTVVEIGETLISSEAVELPDGSSVSRSELEAHAMMSALRDEMKVLPLVIEKLADVIHAKGQVKVDNEKVAQFVAAKLGAEIDAKVAESADRVEKRLKAQEARLAELGDARVSEVTKTLQGATKGLERAERMVSGMKRSLTLAGVGKVAAASIPFALVVLALVMLLGLGGQLFGVGPVFGWAWASFAATEAWWAKLLIALATIAGALGVLWVVKILGQKLYATYRGW